MEHFEISTKFTPKGDQPKAIDAIVDGVLAGRKHQVLLGVTGSGKTFTLANVINRLNKPTIVCTPNKTLAAQLYEELKEFFPKNSVQYFVSYYDFYQPEAYIPSTDTYIEKDSQINEEIDRLRHAATHALLSRNDVIIVCSVSFIYGLGSPELYRSLHVEIVAGTTMKRKALLEGLVNMQYTRNDVDFARGAFRVRGDTVDIFPAYAEDVALRVEFFGDDVESITQIDPIRGVPLGKLPRVQIYPASHYVTEAETRKRAINTILIELRQRLGQLKELGKELEAKRLEQRTLYDIEMMEELGYCQGIENYSRHLTGRQQGDPPPTLLDYFPDGFLVVMDESHVTIPQIGGMYRGDRARKTSLVEHGFRLVSALDNRPLNFDEFQRITESRAGAILYLSATPADYELNKTGGEIVEQIIRPTGLLDPEIEVRPAGTQVEDVIQEVKLRVDGKKDLERTRILVTVLTKKFAEDLTMFLLNKGIRVKYLHSEVETLERIEILRDLRMGVFDVLVGINLLREGLDLPEVSLVAIMDADKEGFLRSERSLIQTIGRAARNAEGKVILYADRITKSMDVAIRTTKERRALQEKYNQEHGIVPQTIRKQIGVGPRGALDASGERVLVDVSRLEGAKEVADFADLRNVKDIRSAIDRWHGEMLVAAKERRFEDAARFRDRVKRLKQLELQVLEVSGDAS